MGKLPVSGSSIQVDSRSPSNGRPINIDTDCEDRLIIPTGQVRSDPLDILWHYSMGYMPDFLDGKRGAVGWVRWPHRGVQLLEKFKIPRKQKSYVMSDQFELRLDHSFEEVVRECANTQRHVIRDGVGQTWITPELMDGFIKLHEMGYAHSYESWMDGQLVGGTFGIQLGGLITMVSLFHRVSNASKAAAGRAMMVLRDRGFKLVDIGMVPQHHVDFGSEWLPRWKYESMLPGLIRQCVSVDDLRPCRPIPLTIRVGAPIARMYRKLRRRLPGNTG